MEAKAEYQQHKDPNWWGADHESTWTRIKDALRRDWEQTKSDFGSETARDLDQDLTDTVKQGAGSQTFPKSPEAINELRQEAAEARRDAAQAGLAARRELDSDIREANEEFREAAKSGDDVSEAARERRENLGEAVEEFEDTVKASSYYKDWRAVAAALRFGAGAAVEYPDARWSPDFESTLREDWGTMDNAHGWAVVRTDVRRGFDSVRDR